MYFAQSIPEGTLWIKYILKHFLQNTVLHKLQSGVQFAKHTFAFSENEIFP